MPAVLARPPAQICRTSPHRHLISAYLESPTAETLKGWWRQSGLPLKRFFNTSGPADRGLGLKDRLPGMSEKEQLDLLSSDGLLVKRPILVWLDFVLVGFSQKQWEEKLL